MDTPTTAELAHAVALEIEEELFRDYSFENTPLRDEFGDYTEARLMGFLGSVRPLLGGHGHWKPYYRQLDMQAEQSQERGLDGL